MKILKIFGLVVGIHVVAFMFVFAIPGCRSSTRHSPPPPQAVQAEAQPVRAATPSPVSDLGSQNLGPVAQNNSISPVANAGTVAGGSTATSLAPTTVSFDSAAPSGAVRANPTRPGTPVATALKTPAPEVTPASTQVVVNGDTLWKIAKQHHLSIKELAAANNLKSDAPVRPGQKLLIPGKAQPSSPSLPNGSTNPADTLTYEVKAGDSLALIAKRAGTTSAAIKQLNHLKSDVVRVGQKLTLPAGSATAATLAGTSSATEGDANSGQSGKTTGGPGVHHTVKPGETLGQIAKHYGVSRRELAVANNIVDPLKLRPGQDLVIPNAKVPSSQSAPHNEMNTPAAATATQAAPASSSPIAPAADTMVNPVASPISGDSGPPVIQVQDSNNPVAAPK